MLLTLCCHDQPSIALWPNWLVQFTSAEHSQKWAQHVCQNSPPVHATGFQTVSWGNKICANAFILYIYAANYFNLTSSLVLNMPDVSNVTWEGCGLPRLQKEVHNKHEIKRTDWWRGMYCLINHASDVLQISLMADLKKGQAHGVSFHKFIWKSFW